MDTTPCSLLACIKKMAGVGAAGFSQLLRLTNDLFFTGGFILVSDYVRMEVTLVGASWVMVAGEQMWTFLARPRMKKDPVSLSACGGEYVKNMITKRRFPREELSDC